MNWTRQQLKSNARLMVKKNWLTCVIVSLIVALLASSRNTVNINFRSGSSGTTSNFLSNFSGQWMSWLLQLAPYLAATAGILAIVGIALDILLGNPLLVGSSRFYLHNIHSDGHGRFDDLAFGFRNQYSNVVKVMFIRDVLTMLWTLLLIVPGIIKTYQYYLVPYLLADNPELEWREALDLSRQMMDGEKWNTFVLRMSFIGWIFLSGILMNIPGVLWVTPYINATDAELYTAIKTRWEGQHGGYAEY